MANVFNNATPCPFCGTKKVFVPVYNLSTYFVSCSNCDAIGPVSESIVGALEKWNYRVTTTKEKEVHHG